MPEEVVEEVAENTKAQAQPEAVEAEQEVEQEAEQAEPEIDPETGEPIEPDEPELEWDEIDVDGKKYPVPKNVKDGYLRQDDYTRKTQEIAKTRQELQAARQQANQLFQANEKEIADRGTLQLINQQLETFKQTDWNQLRYQDRDEHDALWQQYQLLKDARTETANRIQQSAQQRASLAKQDTANRWRQSRLAAKSDPKIGFDPETEKKAIAAIEKLGFSREVVVNAMTPELYRAMHYARIGYELSNQPAKPAKPKVAPPTTPSSKKIRGRSAAPASGLHDKLSPDEWQRRRQAQLKAKHG